MIVLDASAVVELLLWTTAGKRVAKLIENPRETLHAPHLLDVEVAQVMRRIERAGTITSERVEQAMHTLAAHLDIDRHEHTPLLPRVWALRANCTAYDATYIALAEGLGAPLVTLDKRLATAPGHRARVMIA